MENMKKKQVLRLNKKSYYNNLPVRMATGVSESADQTPHASFPSSIYVFTFLSFLAFFISSLNIHLKCFCKGRYGVRVSHGKRRSI